jgi:hypothetical protein
MTPYLMGGYCQASMAASVSANAHVDDVKEPNVKKNRLDVTFVLDMPSIL